MFWKSTSRAAKPHGIIRKLAAYIVLGINDEGKKEVLVLYADGLSGIKEAIGAAYPATEYQRCIVHQIRNTLKYVADKDKKEFTSDLKTIYTAPDEKTGFKQLEIVTT